MVALPKQPWHERSGLLFLYLGLVMFGPSLGYYLYYARQHRMETQADAQRAAERQRIRHAISEFGAAYNAVEDWRKSLRLADDSRLLYSAPLQAALITTDGRPILFVGEIEDVASEADSLRCVFNGYGGIGWQIRFSLTCTPEQADNLMQKRSSVLNRFAVVAQMVSVTKLDGTGPQDGDDEASKYVKFRADGRCIGLLSVGGYLGDFLDLLPRNANAENH